MFTPTEYNAWIDFQFFITSDYQVLFAMLWRNFSYQDLRLPIEITLETEEKMLIYFILVIHVVTFSEILLFRVKSWRDCQIFIVNWLNVNHIENVGFSTKEKFSFIDKKSKVEFQWFSFQESWHSSLNLYRHYLSEQHFKLGTEETHLHYF